MGRPCHTWLRTVTSDLLPLNLGPNAVWRRAQNRDRLWQDTETATLRHMALASDDDDEPGSLAPYTRCYPLLYSPPQ